MRNSSQGAVLGQFAFALKTGGYLITADPSGYHSLAMHVLPGRRVTDLMLNGETALWRLSDKLTAAKQLI